MVTTIGKIAASITTVAIALGPSLTASQSSGGSFEITKHTIDGGGGTSTGGAFALSGTVAQADASFQTASGGNFELTGGFWAKGAITDVNEVIFSDGFEGP